MTDSRNATPQQQALEYLTHVANAFDPVEGPVEFEPNTWMRIRNAIYDLRSQSASTATSGGLVNTLRNMAASSWAATYEHDHVLKQAADRIERLEQRVVQVEQSRVALSASAPSASKPRTDLFGGALHDLRQAAGQSGLTAKGCDRIADMLEAWEAGAVTPSATVATRAKIIEECYIEVAACNGDGFEAERRLRVLIHRADSGIKP